MSQNSVWGKVSNIELNPLRWGGTAKVAGVALLLAVGYLVFFSGEDKSTVELRGRVVTIETAAKPLSPWDKTTDKSVKALDADVKGLKGRVDKIPVIDEATFAEKLLKRTQGLIDEMPKGVSWKTFEDFKTETITQISAVKDSIGKTRLAADLPPVTTQGQAPSAAPEPAKSSETPAITPPTDVSSADSTEFGKVGAALAVRNAKTYNEIVEMQKRLGEQFNASLKVVDKKVDDGLEAARKATEDLRRQLGTAEDAIRSYDATYKAKIAKVEEDVRAVARTVVLAKEAPPVQTAQPAAPTPAMSMQEKLWKDGDRMTRKLRIEQSLSEKCGEVVNVSAVDAAKIEPLVAAPSDKDMQARIVCSEFASADSDKGRYATYFANCGLPKKKPMNRETVNKLSPDAYDELLKTCRGNVNGQAATPAPQMPIRVAERSCPRGQLWEGPVIGCL